MEIITIPDNDDLCFFFLSCQTWELICFVNLFKEPILDMLISSVG